jgi:lipoyl(octanoyl) transferase
MLRPMTGMPAPPVDWVATPGLVAYEAACAAMARRVDAIVRGEAPELVWLLEHPALYTAGTSARSADLIDAARLPVHLTGRGGQYTYHGPGQRVGYCMLDVRRRFGDVRAYVAALEGWLIDALAALDVEGERLPGQVGVFVRRATGASHTHAKIAAIGVRLSRWVSSHGVSLNVAPDLSHYAGIVPCGLREAGVTSLADLGCRASMREVDRALQSAFARRFGPAREAPSVAAVIETDSPPCRPAARGQPSHAG